MSTTTSFCPHCGNEVQAASEPFCRNCGASLMLLAGNTICPNCQAEIQDTDIYCRSCRHFISMDG